MLTKSQQNLAVHAHTLLEILLQNSCKSEKDPRLSESVPNIQHAHYTLLHALFSLYNARIWVQYLQWARSTIIST
jgi:hypothetical protein